MIGLLGNWGRVWCWNKWSSLARVEKGDEVANVAHQKQNALR
jgi:hypothetical protein